MADDGAPARMAGAPCAWSASGLAGASSRGPRGVRSQGRPCQRSGKSGQREKGGSVITAAGIFGHGKRWEDFLSEREMLEVNTEFPQGDTEGLDARAIERATDQLRQPDTGLSTDPWWLIEGDAVIIARAYERAYKSGECEFFGVLDDV